MLGVKKTDTEITLLNRDIGIALLLGLCLCIWAPVSSGDDEEEQENFQEQENFVALHVVDSPQYNKECLDCHASVLSEGSLDPDITRAHVTMLPFVPGEEDEERCIFCHRGVDLELGTPSPADREKGSLRKHVDTTLCAMCHGPSGPAVQLYPVGLSSLVTDGDELYDLVCAGCHRDLPNSEVKGEDADDIQEAIDDDEGGMGPLIVLFPHEIQAIADALAQVGGDDD